MPVKPTTAPVRDETLSTVSTVSVSWSEMADGAGSPAGRISGYRLYQAIGPSSSFVLIYDGSGFRTVRARTQSNLTRGELYRYKVSALNFNGEGPLSDEM